MALHAITALSCASLTAWRCFLQALGRHMVRNNKKHAHLRCCNKRQACTTQTRLILQTADAEDTTSALLLYSIVQAAAARVIGVRLSAAAKVPHIHSAREARAELNGALHAARRDIQAKRPADGA